MGFISKPPLVRVMLGLGCSVEFGGVLRKSASPANDVAGGANQLKDAAFEAGVSSRVTPLNRCVCRAGGQWGLGIGLCGLTPPADGAAGGVTRMLAGVFGIWGGMCKNSPHMQVKLMRSVRGFGREPLSLCVAFGSLGGSASPANETAGGVTPSNNGFLDEGSFSDEAPSARSL